MAQLRAKQIKLNNEGDLLIGGASGSGSVLAKGTVGQVLKVLENDTLGYSGLAANEITVDQVGDLLGTDVQVILSELFDKSSGAQTEVDNVEASVGLNEDGTLAPWNSVNYISNGSEDPEAPQDTVKVAVEKLDTALKTVYDSVSALGNAFNYVGTLEGGADEGTAYDLETLPEGGKDAGDYYKVTVSGFFKVGAEGVPFWANKEDGLVWNTNGGVDVLDHSNSEVTGGQNILVTGSTDTGFTVSIDGIVPVANGGTGVDTLGDVTSDSEAIVLDGVTIGSVIGSFSIGLDASKINFADLAGANAPTAAEEGKYLKWSATGIEYVDIEAAVHDVEEEFVVVASEATPGVGEVAAGANVSFDLGAVPAGDIAVFFNGIKLRKTGFSLVGQTVTLVDAVNSYAAEEGDVLSVSYQA